MPSGPLGPGRSDQAELHQGVGQRPVVPLGRHLPVGDLEHDHAADDDGAAGVHSMSGPLGAADLAGDRVALLATTACSPQGRRPVLRPTATLLATTEETTSGKSSPILGMPTTVGLDVDARWRHAGLSDDAGRRREVQLAAISMLLRLGA